MYLIWAESVLPYIRIDDEEHDTFDSLVQAGVFVESWTWLDVLKPGTYLVMTELSKNGISFIVP